MENSKSKLTALALTIMAITLIVFAANMFNGEDSNIGQGSLGQDGTAFAAGDISGNQTTAVSDQKYTDGTYVVQDNYLSPGGNESIKVTLTVENSQISSAEVEQNADNRESRQYQNDFQKGFKSKVIGKALSSLKLSRVSGASLTTASFNDALDQIRSQSQI